MRAVMAERPDANPPPERDDSEPGTVSQQRYQVLLADAQDQRNSLSDPAASMSQRLDLSGQPFS